MEFRRVLFRSDVGDRAALLPRCSSSEYDVGALGSGRQERVDSNDRGATRERTLHEVGVGKVGDKVDADEDEALHRTTRRLGEDLAGVVATGTRGHTELQSANNIAPTERREHLGARGGSQDPQQRIRLQRSERGEVGLAGNDDNVALAPSVSTNAKLRRSGPAGIRRNRSAAIAARPPKQAPIAMKSVRLEIVIGRCTSNPRPQCVEEMGGTENMIDREYCSLQDQPRHGE